MCGRKDRGEEGRVVWGQGRRGVEGRGGEARERGREGTGEHARQGEARRMEMRAREEEEVEWRKGERVGNKLCER